MTPLTCHLVGDYVLQTDYEASEKTLHSEAAALHAVKYTLCFLPLTRNPRALAAIGVSHYLIDRYRLAKPLNWLKNQAAPARYRYGLSEGYESGHGGRKRQPDYLGFWLMIAVDNTVHLIINDAALRRWP